MNQLIRGQIDLVGFSDWYKALPAEEQVALLCHLHLFAQQAGGREEVFRDAVAAARSQEEHLLVRLLASFRGDFSRELGLTLEDWLTERDENERSSLLPLLVYYFGLSEGDVFARETVTSCNHWWHRDLMDSRVVRDLLNDPQYFLTSMKDDVVVKKADRSNT
jgi:hypothetical protein